MDKRYFVYILSNQKNGTLYIGVTSNLIKRISEHKDKKLVGFTKRYSLDKLVYYEVYGEVGMAIYREKQIKKWRRAWKIGLVEKDNPSWKDLFGDLFE
ncbi:MAG: GIY-YIG nuclease superfamily protein [Parcubacteria group bacterium ADurb.Bin316]|nr:MAG: GIY-YIG nuclease superfamily protein [Parcubacteria group bacterium ADurb.Bin316]HOZ56034.1 GIY-YIG nuclease family protein [bacterium]